MSGQYSSRLGWDSAAALARVTGLPSAADMNSAKPVSSEVRVTPSGSVTRTGGRGFPSSGGVVKAARQSNIVGHFFGFLALTTFPVSVSTKASERSLSNPRSVSSDALSSSPIIDFTGYRHNETTAPSSMSPPGVEFRGVSSIPCPSRARLLTGWRDRSTDRDWSGCSLCAFRLSPLPRRVATVSDVGCQAVQRPTAPYLPILGARLGGAALTAMTGAQLLAARCWPGPVPGR